MTYIPKMALELKTFSSVEEMNHHMNLHYLGFKSPLTKSFDVIFHWMKKYACRVAGVCWLKQEKLASLAEVSVKTVERAVKFLKDQGAMKIYHTKRSNGLNGNCYYVLQPFKGVLEIDDEMVVSVEEGDVGAVKGGQSYETPEVREDFLDDKLFISSYKALENSLKKNEEEINNNARVKPNLHNHEISFAFCKEEFISLLLDNDFSKESAKKITNRVLQASQTNIRDVMNASVRALNKFKKRKAYHQPIYSVVDYFVRLVGEELNTSSKSEKPKMQQKPAFSNKMLEVFHSIRYD